MRYIYMACLSMGGAFFVLRAINHHIFPEYIQDFVQPTQSDDVQLQSPKTTIVQQNIREQRNTIEVSDEIQQSILKLQERSVYLDIQNTSPGQTSRQGIILSNDGLVLISKFETGTIETIKATTATDRTYTGTRYVLSSPYFDVLELDMGDQILEVDTTFTSLQSLPSIGEMIAGIQHLGEPGIVSGQINHIASTTGIRHILQFDSASPHTLYTRLNGDILGTNISGDTKTIFPITSEFVTSIIDEYNTLKGITKQEYMSYNESTLPFDIINSRANAGNTVFGRELGSDFIANDKVTILSGTILTRFNDTLINTTLNPNVYAPLFSNDGVIIEYYIEGKPKTVDRTMRE